MYTSYRKAIKGSKAGGGYKDVVVVEDWKSRRDYWRGKLAARWLIHQFDHREIVFDEEFWEFKRNPYQRLGDWLISRLIGRPEEPARTYYERQGVPARPSILEEDP